jgi:hypothetical protein
MLRKKHKTFNILLGFINQKTLFVKHRICINPGEY